eukprot:6092600-Prorocentrum_lima.AAC.1
MKKDRIYTTLEDLVWQGKDWVSDAVSTLLQECTGNLVLLVRVLPQLPEPERDFIFEFLPRLMQMVKWRTTEEGVVRKSFRYVEIGLEHDPSHSTL